MPDVELLPADTSAVPPELLLLLAARYQTAQDRLIETTTQASQDLFLHTRPITEPDLGQWESSWNALLSGAAQVQENLTNSYWDTQMAMMGTHTPPPVRVPVTTHDVGKAVSWLGNTGAANAPSLADEVENVLRDLADMQSKTKDAFTLDRIKWLHTPVLDVRGDDEPGDRWVRAANGLGPMVDGHVREVERSVLNNRSWPRFANGDHMVYFRVPQAGACGWCRVVATRMYSERSGRAGLRWHQGCRCVWRVATEAEARRYSAKFRSADRNYYEAAAEVGLWEGDTQPGAFQDVIHLRFDPQMAYDETGYRAYRSDGVGVQVWQPSTGKFSY